MANENRGMIKYTSRDYDSIMQEFWDLVPKLTDLWKPDTESDPGVVLGKFLASIADMLGVNIDWLANEIFAPSVTQRKNAEKLFDLIGYKLGWYTAAKTEVTFTNNSSNSIILDFGFNGANFSTVTAYTDITGQNRVITYNIMPMTSGYGDAKSKASRKTISESINVFSDMDMIVLNPGDSITKIAIEGELRSYSISVESVKKNNYLIKIPSQHIDTTAIWIRAKSSLSQENVNTQWVQVDSPAEFIVPEPRFAVTYDNYSNAQIQISNYLNQLDGYDSNYLIIYWIECSGLIGSVGQNVLRDFKPALTPLQGDATTNSYDADKLTITNLSNTLELPHTYTVTGRSPETAKQAYINSRNYINTWDSLITLPDFNRFLNRESGVDCGIVIDCQKALEINLAIYNDGTLTPEQKKKMLITSSDFPMSEADTSEWRSILGEYADLVIGDMTVPVNFKTYTAVCYAVHNDFNNSTYKSYDAKNPVVIKQNTPTMKSNGTSYLQYKPPISFIEGVLADFRPLQAMTVELQFGYARIFPWYIVGQIYPKNPMRASDAANLVNIVREKLALYFAPANRQFGQKPTIMEVVDVIQNADDRIRYFDAGSLTNNVINWGQKITTRSSSYVQTYDIDYFNPISFAMYTDPSDGNIRVAPEYISN